jgi:hypothetical protein
LKLHEDDVAMNHGKTGAEVEIIALGRDAFSPVWNPSLGE